jgi:hypothetical protein
MKTIKEYFESVENPILKKVLLMSLPQKYDYLVHDLQEAIFCQFAISGIVDGFWIQVTEELKSSTESPTFNAKYPVMQVEWLDENECIHCGIEEEANQICKLMHNVGLKWLQGETYESTTRYYESRCRTCYFPFRGIWDKLNLLESTTVIYPAKLFIKSKMENLLKEAKLRYPIGCVVKHPLDKELHLTIDDFNFYLDGMDNNIFCSTTYNKQSPLRSCIYYKEQWAKYVEVFGFKVGDVLDKDILTEWTKIGQNWNDNNKWEVNLRPFRRSRTIESIEYINNSIALKIIVNTYPVYIKAEGLREFINSKQKQMETLTELPKYFVVKRDNDNPLWEKYIDWLNKSYSCTLTGEDYCYYGMNYSGTVMGVNYLGNIKSEELITLEQWDSIVNKTKFEFGRWYTINNAFLY